MIPIKAQIKKNLTEKPTKKAKAPKAKKPAKPKKESVKKTGVKAIDEEKEKRLADIAQDEEVEDAAVD